MTVFILCDHNRYLDPLPLEAFISMELAMQYRDLHFPEASEYAYPIFEMAVMESLE